MSIYNNYALLKNSKIVNNIPDPIPSHILDEFNEVSLCREFVGRLPNSFRRVRYGRLIKRYTGFDLIDTLSKKQMEIIAFKLGKFIDYKLGKKTVFKHVKPMDNNDNIKLAMEFMKTKRIPNIPNYSMIIKMAMGCAHNGIILCGSITDTEINKLIEFLNICIKYDLILVPHFR